MAATLTAAADPSTPSRDATAEGRGIPRAMVWLLATAVGVTIVNLTAPQILASLIASDLGLPPAWAGTISTAVLFGYAAGLFFLVPLADLAENRRLVTGMLGIAVTAAFAAAVTGPALPFLGLLFALGAACSVIQVLVPIAASMARESERGRVVGDVTSGIMIGIVLSRPLASLVADGLGWRAFYVVSGLGMLALIPVLRWRLPLRRPEQSHSYPAIIASLGRLLRDELVLRRRSITAALGLAAYMVFWSAIAQRLGQAPFGFDQRHVALFALFSLGDALVTPLAGRAADRGWSRPMLVAAHAAMILGFALAACADRIDGAFWLPLVLLGLSAMVLDIGVFTDQTVGRRAVNMLAPEARGRLNALFVGIFFLGGSVGSAVAGWAWAAGGWSLVCLVGAGFGALALVSDLTERKVATA